MVSGKIDTMLALLSPLSHIGDSAGPDSYLSTQTVISQTGEVEEVFVYSGNAVRGVLRDCGSRYFLDNIGNGAIVQIPLELFYLFFSGGSIGGKQSINIDQAREIRRKIPHLSIFGGGVGNMLLPGKLNVGQALPVCREVKHIVPDHILEQTENLSNLSWRQMTTEQSYTRKDDAKDDLLRVHIQGQSLAIGQPEQLSLAGDTQPEELKDDKSPQQMRYTLEMLAAGAVLWQEIVFYDMTEIELGALVASITEWAKNPVIGGQSRIGMGKVNAEMNITLPETKESEHFLSVGQAGYSLSERASEAKYAYDRFLNKYAEYLQHNRQDLLLTVDGKEGA